MEAWKFKYSTDDGKSYYPEDITSAETVPINSSVDLKRYWINIKYRCRILDLDRKATLDDIWIADNTYSYCDPE